LEYSPLVEGLRLVEALVALEPDQLSPHGPCERLGQLCLPDTGRTLDQDRLAKPRRQKDDRSQTPVRDVALLGQPLTDLFYALKQISPSRIRLMEKRSWPPPPLLFSPVPRNYGDDCTCAYSTVSRRARGLRHRRAPRSPGPCVPSQGRRPRYSACIRWRSCAPSGRTCSRAGSPWPPRR
jgi:hypothetical protein